ncbi:hypothetical protein LCGC14_3034910, partial [marine sediment metagenome]
ANADSNNYGLIAGGGNIADAGSNVNTRAYLGKEVTVTSGTDIGGLTDGEIYYAVLDNQRSFNASDVDSVANTIDLGADHGLQTGDLVIYKHSAHDENGVGTVVGVDDLATYEVVVDVSNLIRLKNPQNGASINLDTAGADPTGHSFTFINPRQVKLAATYEDAVAQTPIVRTLDNSVASGSAHTLTPFGGIVASSIPFDPLGDVGTETINLGADHGLLTGQAVVYKRGAGAALTITATGDDFNFAKSEAGSGGLVAGAAAVANVTANSRTRAYLADDIDGDSVKTDLRVSSLTIRAAHTAHFDTQTDTFQASVVGFSGSWANNDVDSTVEARIGESAVIETENLVVDAVNTSRKNLLG